MLSTCSNTKLTLAPCLYFLDQTLQMKVFGSLLSAGFDRGWEDEYVACDSEISIFLVAERTSIWFEGATMALVLLLKLNRQPTIFI